MQEALSQLGWSVASLQWGVVLRRTWCLVALTLCSRVGVLWVPSLVLAFQPLDHPPPLWLCWAALLGHGGGCSLLGTTPIIIMWVLLMLLASGGTCGIREVSPHRGVTWLTYSVSALGMYTNWDCLFSFCGFEQK